MNKFNFDDAPNNAYQFLAGDVQTQIDKTGDKTKRTFSGIAYHGGQIDDHWYWGNLVFDLDNLDLANGKVPMLVEHDRDQRCGFINSHNIGDAGLNIEGTLLSNEHGATIANDADEGYPWQMSVSITPKRVESIESGTVTVNGREFNAPVTIFRQNTIREVSFCALGADRHTSAQIFNENRDHKPKEYNVDLEKAKATIEELNASLAAKSAELQTAIDGLAQFKQAKRDSDIEALAAKTGHEFSEDKLTALKSMDETSFSMFASMMPAKTEQKGFQLPQELFNEQATHGVKARDNGETGSFETKFNEWSEA